MALLPALANGLITALTFLLFSRFLLQSLGIAPQSNPWAESIYRSTRPVDLLNRVMPPLMHGKFLGSALFLICLLKLADYGLSGFLRHIELNQLPQLGMFMSLQLVSGALMYFKGILIIYVIMSWVSLLFQKNYAFTDLVMEIAEPMLAPLRARLPNLGPLDLSVLVALLLFTVGQKMTDHALLQFSGSF